MNRNVLIVVLVLLAFVAAQAPAASKKTHKPATAPTSAPTSTPASAQTYTPQQEQEVMAIVNGRTIYMSELNQMLLYADGLPLAQQLVTNELVNQECARKHIDVGAADVEAEHARSLKIMFKDINTADQREKAFEQLLVEKNVSRPLWNLIIRRNVQLAKLAEGEVKITDEDVKKFFGDRYGRKVEVRHIQVESVATAQTVMDQLKKGADFVALSQLKSTNANTRGKVLTISSGATTYPLAMRETALAMEKIGDLSPIIQTGTAFHILKLEKIVDPENVKFDDIRDTLRKELLARRIQETQQLILLRLIKKAEAEGKIEYVNPTLRKLDETAKAASAAQPTPN